MIRKILTTLARQERDPRYVFVLIGSALIFILCGLQVLNKGLFDSVEQPVFAYFNTLPVSFYGFMYAVTQFGGLASLVIWVAAAWYLVHRRAAITVAATGVAAWLLAKVAKVLFHRGRPGSLLEDVQLFGGETLGGFGFPSGHATFAAACAAVLYFYINRRYRKYLLALVVVVGISRMYLGAHFPLDIVGGWALGALTASAGLLLFGMPGKTFSTARLKAFLTGRGYPVRSMSLARVDARGSRPLLMTTADGTDYFAKYFGTQEHAADWLFKLLRFFRYKNLHGEEPFLNRRRNVEAESFAMLWARNHRVRVPKVVELIRYSSAWLLIQEKIEAKPLSEHGHILQRTLDDTWRQVSKLHAANVAHRDLRAANIMIDKQGKAWLVDFGFAEVSPRRQRTYMDIAELLMSMSLAAGVKRTATAACRVLDRDSLVKAMPYLQKAVFSTATTRQLSSNKDALDALRGELQACLDIEEPVEEADIVRITPRKILNLALIAMFIYIIVPQFGSFKDAFTNVTIQNPEWLVPLALASLGTYVLTGLIYVALSEVPLKIWQSSLVQLAASFISKFLPGGLASAGLNARYLTRAGMDRAAASGVLVTQGIIGFIMFAVPLAVFLLINGQSIDNLFAFNISGRLLAGLVAAVLAGITIISMVEKYRAKAAHAIIKFFDHLRVLASPSRELGVASAASFGVTVCYIFCLYAAFKVLGIPLSVTAAVLVYATATIARSAIPTPGGLGPLEIAMVAALVGFGVSKPDAFTAVILYRLATFWLPIPISLAAYRYLDKKKLI